MEFDNIPKELKELSSWVVWRYTQQPNREKPAKIPFCPKTGKTAKTNQPDKDCTDFNTAIKALNSNAGKKNTAYSGIGIVLTNNLIGLIGIDLDNCLENGKISPQATEILEKFQDTYIEISPSGRGLRIFCFGEILRSGKNTGGVKWIEVYDSKSPRYLTVTGNAWVNNEVKNAQNALNWLFKQYFHDGNGNGFNDDLNAKSSSPANAKSSSPANAKSSSPANAKSSSPANAKSSSPDANESPAKSPALLDAKILSMLNKAKNSNRFKDLWSGGNEGKGESEGDYALCNLIAFYTQDAIQINRLVSQSNRENVKNGKWNSKRGNSSYGLKTAEKAIANCKKIYTKHNDTTQQSTTGEKWRDELLAHVLEFNKNFSQVFVGGKHRILHKDSDGEFQFSAQVELEKLYQNKVIQTGITPKMELPKYDNHIAAWAKHSKSKVYRGGVVFNPCMPAGDNGNVFNTWEGFAIKPKENNDLLALIESHIQDVICDGNQELIQYIYDWIAYTFQKPNNPVGAAIVCRGEKGTGKGTLGHFLMKLWGCHAFHIASAKHLVGNFNGHLQDVCFLFADEAFFSGDRQHEGVLKALITEPTLTIERKGIDAIQQPNFLKIFMCTNADYAVPATRDERRYCVCDVSSERRGDNNYFKQLHADCDNKEVQAAFLFKMLKRNIDDFAPSNIPETEGLKYQRIQSLNSVGKWLVDCFTAGKIADESEWNSKVSAGILRESYLGWCDTQKLSEFNRLTQTAMGVYLGKIGYKKVRTMEGRFWWLGDEISEAIQIFEDYEKVKLNV